MYARATYPVVARVRTSLKNCLAMNPWSSGSASPMRDAPGRLTFYGSRSEEPWLLSERLTSLQPLTYVSRGHITSVPPSNVSRAVARQQYLYHQPRVDTSYPRYHSRPTAAGFDSAATGPFMVTRTGFSPCVDSPGEMMSRCNQRDNIKPPESTGISHHHKSTAAAPAEQKADAVPPRP